MNSHRCPGFPPHRFRNLGLTLIAVLFFFCGSLQAQVTIRVPADQPTIQGGINAANNGDTVLVSPGTYNEAIHFNGKAITVTSGATSYSDPVAASTIIRQPQYGKPVVFYGGLETLSTVLNGFTIIGLAQDPGTGSGNGTFYSPIIWGPNSHPTITNNDISSGVAGVNTLGGFIASNHFSGFIQAALQTGAATVAGNVFENTSPEQAALSADGNTIVERNIFRNTGYSAAQLADGVVFVNNLVYGSQGPVLYSASSGSSIKTIIAENTFNNLSLPNGAPRCINNAACATGSQISVSVGNGYFGSALLIANNIFYSNDAVAMIGCQPYNSTVPANTDTLLLDHNIFYSTAGAPMLSAFCRAPITPAGNVSTDPRLANPSAGDFHLRPGSPAIDAGNNSIFTQVAALGFTLDSDFDRNPRPQDGTGLGYPVVDIGAYEAAGMANGQPTGVLLTPSAYDLQLGLSLTLYVTVTSPLGVPFGTVSLFDNGVLDGSATLSSLGTATFQPAHLNLGVNEFVADYAGNTPFAPGVSLKIIVRVELVPTHLALTATPNPARPGTQVVLNVTASADDGSVPSPIALTDNGSALATLLPNSAGVATASISNLALGAHTIVATYAGDGRHPPASATLILNIVSHDFTLTVDPAALALRTEYHSTVMLHLAPVGDFAENVTVACLGLPTNATCTLSRTSLVLGLPTDIQDVIDTDFVLRFRSSLDGPGSHPSPDRSHPLTFLAWIPILLFGRPLRRSAFTGRNGRLARPNLMLLSLLLCGLTALTACSGKYPGSTPPGTYVITIQAVSTSGITHSAPLTLTVTP